MRFFILSVFLLSLFLSVVHGQYAGIFLNTASKAKAASLKASTSPYAALNATDNSRVKTEAHHMTIEFKPSPPEKFADFDGVQYDVRILAYVHDTHAQAVLVALEGNPCQPQNGEDGIAIANAWPHVTISHQAQTPYNAVYSNDLVARVIAQKILRVKKVDPYGKPTIVGLYHGNSEDGAIRVGKTNDEWWGISGNYTAPATATTAQITYPATEIYVKVFPQAVYPYYPNVVRLTGTECYNTRWNDTTTTCKLL